MFPSRTHLRPGRIAPLLAVMCGAAWLVHAYSRPSIRMDGIGYYLPLASVVFDGDLDLHNEVAHLDNYMRNRYFVAPDGRLVDPFAIGTAILWSPAVWLASRRDPARDSFGQPGSWQNASPGFQPRYERAVAIATAAFALLGAVLLFVTLLPRTGAASAWAGCLGATLGTPLVYYALADPSYAHAASFLCCSALLAAAVTRRRMPWPVLGALWGLTCLVRWQDAVLGILLVPRLHAERAALRTARSRLRAGFAFALPALLVFAPQMLFWQSLYGRPLLVPMGPGFMQWFTPHVLPLLFSTWHGAFVWSPLLLLGLAGVACVPERALRWALWAAVLLEIYASASVSDWWGSAGFGARRLVAIAPIAGFGLGHAARWFTTRVADRRRVVVVVAAVVVTLGIGWNLRLAQYELAGLLPSNPGNIREYARDDSPGDAATQLIGWWDHPRLWRELLVAERHLWRRPGRGGNP